MDSTIDMLKLGLDGAMKRQKAISNNIANVDTPNYKRKDVDFLSVLKKEAASQKNNIDNNIDSPNSSHGLSLLRTNKKHIHNVKNNGDKSFNIKSVSDTKYRNDDNNVDIDHEMAELAKTNIYYNTLAQRISSKFKSLNQVISKGGN